MKEYQLYCYNFRGEIELVRPYRTLKQARKEAKKWLSESYFKNDFVRIYAYRRDEHNQEGEIYNCWLIKKEGEIYNDWLIKKGEK